MFTQKFCQNNRSKLKSIKKAKKVVGETMGVLWGCRGGAKNEDGFFSANSVNFFKKPTSYWNLKKNWKKCGNFFKKIRKFRNNFENFGKLWTIFKNFEKFFLKIPKSDGIFQKILNISKKFLSFTQKWCRNNKRVH